MPSRCPTPSPAASCGRCATRPWPTTRVESNFPFRCYRSPNLKKAAKPSLFHKCLAYQATRAQRVHTERYGWGGFRVITVTAKSGVQVSRDPTTGEPVRQTRLTSLQAAARLAAPEAPPGFFLFADLPSLKRADDVLTMRWQTDDPTKSAVLELKPESLRAAS